MKKVRLGPKCSAVISETGDMLVVGSNRGNRLLLSTSKAKMLQKVFKVSGVVSDVRFGPFHTVILKKDGRILNIIEQSSWQLQEPAQMVAIDTTCNREKCNFGLAKDDKGHIYKWKIEAQKANASSSSKGPEANAKHFAAGKEHFLLSQ